MGLDGVLWCVYSVCVPMDESCDQKDEIGEGCNFMWRTGNSDSRCLRSDAQTHVADRRASYSLAHHEALRQPRCE